MINHKKTGRMIGILFLIQMVGAMMVNFNLTTPLFVEPGFLINGAELEDQVGFAALLALLMSSLSLVIAILVYPLFKQHNPSLALVFLVLSSIGLVLSAVEQMGVMGLVSYSKAYVAAPVADQAMMESMKGVVASIRNFAHYTALIFGGITLMVFYIILFHYKLVPLLLAGFGIIALMAQLSTTAMPFFGFGVDFLFLVPIALCQLILSLYLMAKGFNEFIPKDPS